MSSQPSLSLGTLATFNVRFAPQEVGAAGCHGSFPKKKSPRYSQRRLQ